MAAAGDDTGSGKVLDATEKWLAIVLVIVYVVVLGILIALRNDTNWERLIYVLGGLEAVVFAAAGALFGTSVQRGQTDAARDDARQQRALAVERQSRVLKLEEGAAVSRVLADRTRTFVTQLEAHGTAPVQDDLLDQARTLRALADQIP